MTEDLQTTSSKAHDSTSNESNISATTDNSCDQNEDNHATNDENYTSALNNGNNRTSTDVLEIEDEYGTQNGFLLSSVKNNMQDKEPQHKAASNFRGFKIFQKVKLGPTQKIFIVGLLLLTIQMVYAGYSVISVLYVKDFSLNVYLLTFTRVLIAAPLSIVLAITVEGTFSFKAIQMKEYLFFFLLGFSSSALNPIFYLLVVTYTSATYTAILSQLMPVFSSILSISLKLEPFPSIKNRQTLLRLAGIIICISFAAAVSAIGFVTPPDGILWRNWLIGTIIGVINNFIYTLYMVMQLKLFYRSEKSQFKTKPFTVNCLATCFGGAVYIVPALIYLLVDKVNLKLPAISALPILYAGVLNSTVCFGLLTFCIKNSSAIISSCLYSIQIVSSMILLYLFANESIFVSQYICSAFVIAGALMTILSPLLKQQPYIPKSVSTAKQHTHIPITDSTTNHSK